jgi:hypothetical protein
LPLRTFTAPTPLEATLEALIDFDRLNAEHADNAP